MAAKDAHHPVSNVNSLIVQPLDGRRVGGPAICHQMPVDVSRVGSAEDSSSLESPDGGTAAGVDRSQQNRDTKSPLAQQEAQAGSLEIFDLDDFGLDRFLRLGAGRAFHIARLQHGTWPCWTGTDRRERGRCAGVAGDQQPVTQPPDCGARPRESRPSASAKVA